MKKIMALFMSGLLSLTTLPGCKWFGVSDSGCCSHASHNQTTTTVTHVESKAAFEDLIQKAEKPVVVKFGAAWCGACQELAPIFQQVAHAHSDHYLFAEVSLDRAKELAKDLDINGIPVVCIFNKGKEVNPAQRLVGAVDEKTLVAHIEKHLK